MLDADLSVTPATGKVISSADSLAGVLAAIDGVAAAEPVLAEQGLLTYGDRQMPVNLKGVTPRWRHEVASLDSLLIDANMPMVDYGATLSVGVAMKLGARPGFDRVGVYMPRRVGRVNPANPLTAFRADTTFVAAVFQSEQGEWDNDVVFVPVGMLRALLDYDTEASSLALKLSPEADPAKVARAVAGACGPAYRVADRLEQQESSRRMIEIEKWISFAMLGFILLIASFNVISTLSMLIIEKRGSMAVLGALGATPAERGRIFMWQGILVSAIGGAAGLIAGAALTLAQQWGGFIRLGGDHSRMTVTVYPVSLETADLLAVAGIVLVTGGIVGSVAALMARRGADSGTMAGILNAT